MANVYLVWLDISWEISNNVKQAHTVLVIAFPYMFCNIKEIICKCSLNTRAMDLKFNSHLCIIDLKATICDWVVYSWVINNFVKVHAVILVKKQKNNYIIIILCNALIAQLVGCGNSVLVLPLDFTGWNLVLRTVLLFLLFLFCFTFAVYCVLFSKTSPLLHCNFLRGSTPCIKWSFRNSIWLLVGQNLYPDKSTPPTKDLNFNQNNALTVVWDKDCAISLLGPPLHFWLASNS